MSTPLEDHVRREFRRFLVQKTIFCGLTGEVLDMDKSVFINDADGDPAVVISQTGYQRLLAANGGTSEGLFKTGYSVDESTVD